MAKKHLNVSVYIEGITPERARELTASGPNPRGKSSQRSVSAYARMMSAGRWKVGPPVMLDEKGILMDGFTRCAAVELANITVQFLVLDGIPREAAEALDNGQARGKESVLTNQCGVRHYAKMMSGLIVGIVNMPYRNLVVKNADMQPLYELYSSTVDWTIGVFGGKHCGHVRMAIITAFARAHLAGRTPATLETLGLRYVAQDWDTSSPLRLLSLYVANNPRCHPGDLYLRAARAIDAAVLGERLGVLKAGDDPFPTECPL